MKTKVNLKTILAVDEHLLQTPFEPKNPIELSHS
jgi:hypothetical protein